MTPGSISLAVMPLSALGWGAIEVLKAILIVVAFVALAVLLRYVTDRYLTSRRLRPDAAMLMRRAVITLVLLVGTFVLLADVFRNQLVGLSGILVAALIASLGLQDIVKSFVAGFYVILERNVRVGDEIEIEGQRGVVTDVKMRLTFLRAADGSEIVVPNSDLFSNILKVRPPAGGGRPSVEGAEDHPNQGGEGVAL